MATPYAAAAAGLLFAQNPKLKRTEVEDMLKRRQMIFPLKVSMAEKKSCMTIMAIRLKFRRHLV